MSSVKFDHTLSNGLTNYHGGHQHNLKYSVSNEKRTKRHSFQLNRMLRWNLLCQQPNIPVDLPTLQDSLEINPHLVFVDRN